ncbi:MAG: DUF6036 family nucleotidyltransferase [Pyrinomonadaceae bacterium]
MTTTTNKPPEPWHSFLRDIDDFVAEETFFDLLGGFVVTVIYGALRTTRDFDALSVIRQDPQLLEYAGRGGQLHKKYKIYFDPVGVAPLPENYEERLNEIFPGTYSRLRLFALDPYDIALTKIERNTTRDREDVKHLARVVPFDVEILKRRYTDELRVYLGNPDREDVPLKLWVEMIEEERAS